MALFRKILCLVVLVTFMTGFRTFSKDTFWNVTVASPKIFVRFCQTPIITTNDLPPGDPLYGQTLTFTSVMTSIYNDFTNIPGAYVVLADAATDSEWATSTNRTIQVCFAAQTGRGGSASQKMGSGGKLTSCEIQMDPALNTSAKGFIKTLSHEIGHCLGLDHTQDDDHALMSYFSDSSIVRLQLDDKTGIIQQFPVNRAYANETATLGASCAPQN